MANSLDSDAMLDTAIELYEEWKALREELHKSLRDGWFLMTKTRKSLLPARSLTKDSYDMTMKAQSWVSPGAGEDWDLIRRTALNQPEREDELEAIPIAETPQDSSSLRYRGQDVSLADLGLATKSTKETVNDVDEEGERVLVDPVTWFTFLPPPDLRKAQGKFRTATELAVRLACLSARMDSIEKDFTSKQAKAEREGNAGSS
eukprot:TRINITY_DN1727_c0_g1_i4.p1 TRINITY_DN1727_c0_g1~~TRINITY_DN1727_c0_g1_i4.p1  ORF type:complete len:204 (-),score=30.73 TRINITY_DN1727_c0_g1_i4:945-1556(-)